MMQKNCLANASNNVFTWQMCKQLKRYTFALRKYLKNLQFSHINKYTKNAFYSFAMLNTKMKKNTLLPCKHKIHSCHVKRTNPHLPDRLHAGGNPLREDSIAI